MNRAETRNLVGRPRRMIASLLVAGGLAADHRAFAQQPEVTGNLAQARALFDQGRQLLKKGSYAEACDKFEASERLDSGVGTRFNLADCREKQGKTATAWALFLDIAAETKLQGDRRREDAARRRVADLEPRLSRLALRVGSDGTRLEVRRDGQLVDPAAFNVALPIDPGQHVITAVAPGRAAFREVFSVEGEGKLTALDIPQLAPVAAKHGLVAARPYATDVPSTRAAPNKQRLELVYGALAVGAAGIGTGTYFALRTASKRHALSDICSSGTGCSASELETYASTRSDATTARALSFVGFAVGAFGVTTAAVAYFTGKQLTKASVVSFQPLAEPTLLGGNLTCTW